MKRYIKSTSQDLKNNFKYNIFTKNKKDKNTYHWKVDNIECISARSQNNSTKVFSEIPFSKKLLP